MPIQFTCPHCNKSMTVADQYGGQAGPCQACGQQIMIPLGSPTGYSAPAPKKKSGGGALVVVLIVLGIVGVLGVGCIVGGLVLVGSSLGPAVTAARGAARRTQSSNNLKLIGLAMHNYHDTFGTFPPAYIPDADGKPRTSWRVMILPFMDELGLAEQYDHNEGWDSDANAFVLDREHPTYHSPESTEDISTASYFVVTGANAIFTDDKAPRFRDILDGTSNTILAVEVDGLDVHWAEPRDISIDELMALLQQRQVSGNADGFNALLADGSVRFISYDVDPAVLRGLLTKDGGEKVMDY